MRKKMSTKWLTFLYIIFIVGGINQVVNDIGDVIAIENSYNYASIDGRAWGYFFLFTNTILLIIKIITVVKRYTEVGYKLLFVAMVSQIALALFALLSLGTSGNPPVVLGNLIGTLAIYIPSIVYVVKRKCLFYPESESTENNKKMPANEDTNDGIVPVFQERHKAKVEQADRQNKDIDECFSFFGLDKEAKKEQVLKAFKNSMLEQPLKKCLEYRDCCLNYITLRDSKPYVSSQLQQKNTVAPFFRKPSADAPLNTRVKVDDIEKLICDLRIRAEELEKNPEIDKVNQFLENVFLCNDQRAKAAIILTKKNELRDQLLQMSKNLLERLYKDHGVTIDVSYIGEKVFLQNHTDKEFEIEVIHHIDNKIREKESERARAEHNAIAVVPEDKHRKKNLSKKEKPKDGVYSFNHVLFITLGIAVLVIIGLCILASKLAR